MLELLVDGEIIKLVHVLEKPQVVVQALRLFGILHHLADVQKLHVNSMHVHVLALALLQTELRLFERRLEHICSVVLNSILGNNLCRILLSKLILKFFGLIVEVLPYDITRLLLLRSL
jgi:hypothetical protein